MLLSSVVHIVKTFAINLSINTNKTLMVLKRMGLNHHFFPFAMLYFKERILKIQNLDFRMPVGVQLITIFGELAE